LNHRKGAPEFSFSYAVEAQGGNWLVRGQTLQVREVYRVEAEIVCANGGARETRTVEITARDTLAILDEPSPRPRRV